MAKVKFKSDGRMADLGKSEMPQFEHEKGQVIDVSPCCADSAVNQGLAEHYKEPQKPGPKPKAEKPGPKPKAEGDPSVDDKEASEG